ncbi:MAG: alkaline phosphatase family protein [Nocardioides sp.]|nr:alkaline phosphatase family protein [Nocardioides sp.]
MSGPGVHEEFVEPAYERRSLGDVVPAVGRALGFVLPELAPAGPSGLVLPDAASYVVLLVDGLGARLLQRYAYAAPYLAELFEDQEPGTAGVPSTTATSLTSLGTGLPPGSHGMVGFTSRVPETGKLLNALLWDQDVDPAAWQPHPTAFARLQAAGLPVTVVNKAEFAGSGLTRAAHRGAAYVGGETVGERLAAAVLASSHGPSLVYLYDGDLDKIGHRYGVASQQWLAQLSTIDDQAEQLRESLPSSIRLVVVADHGMVDAPPEHRIDVDEHLELRDGLALLGGEARFRHLYSQRGAVDDLVATWRDHLGDRADVLTRDEAIDRGWFGPVTGPVRPRLGDVVVASRGDHAVFSSVDFGYETTLVGLHGSLSADEMLIPILVD